MRTRVITRFAAADETLGAALRAVGIDVFQTASADTSIFVNDYAASGGDDRRQEVLALADPIENGALRGALRECDLAYLGPLHPDDISQDALTKVTESKTFVIALDVQGYTRAINRGRVEAKIDDRIWVLLRACDVVKANRNEALLLTGSTDPAKAATDLLRPQENLESVVTCGRRGAYIASGDDVFFQPAEEVETDDPTGAGDIFFAAYLTRRIWGEPIESAARSAAHFTARRLRDPTRTVRLIRG